ncbi:capsular exopolysaccharide family [Devosia sp. YR412]|uniref:GumC family protein n=1 Tax=Devosia sp. YR412 TaxID=1881030 RepID=UPI0008C51566|nr:Wzz/FepE/Etk N-terminal domain-containing protein [Devosia sp. YR412]SEP95432.1 capsular exopolysaccharide family [Devosia sp. YR412]
MDEQYFDLRSVLGVLRRRFRLIAMVLVAVLIVTSGVVFSLKPEYTASALVMVDPSRKDLLDPDGMQGTSSSSDSARVDSEVEIVKSMPTMLRVVEKAGLLQDPDFQPTIGLRQQLMAFFRLAEPKLPTGEEALNDVVAKVMNSVSVRRRGLTYLISISADAASPETAAKVANAVAEAYIESQLQSKTQSILGSLSVLQPRIADATAALAASESAYDTFIDVNLQRIIDDTGRQDIAALRSQFTAATSEASRLSSAVETASQGLTQLNYEQVASALQSEALATLEQQRADLLNRLNAVASDDPAAVDLRAELGSLSSQLSATAETEIASLRQQVSANQDRATTLRDNLRQTVLGGELPADVLTSIYELQQNSSLSRANYERLVARVNDLNNQAAVQIADSRVVAPASAPSSPSFPNTRLILVMAALFALGLGAALAFLVENFVGGFTSPEQLEAVTRREVAATIPYQKAIKRPDGTQSSSASDAIIASPLSQFSESLRRLRLRVDQTMAQSGVKSTPGKGKLIVVTSSVPVEGKTTTAIGLARTYSAAGMKVLLIDGDLRKPSVNSQLEISSSDGLFDYLSGTMGAELPTAIVSKDPISDVAAIVGARHSGVPTEQLLASNTFVRLVEAGKAAFDVVILDTPPIGVVVDGIYVMQLADAIVFVTCWGQTTQREVVRSLEAVERSKRPETPILLAMTQQPPTGNRYQNKYYSYYSEV